MGTTSYFYSVEPCVSIGEYDWGSHPAAPKPASRETAVSTAPTKHHSGSQPRLQTVQCLVFPDRWDAWDEILPNYRLTSPLRACVLGAGKASPSDVRSVAISWGLAEDFSRSGPLQPHSFRFWHAIGQCTRDVTSEVCSAMGFENMLRPLKLVPEELGVPRVTPVTRKADQQNEIAVGDFDNHNHTELFMTCRAASLGERRQDCTNIIGSEIRYSVLWST
jgi:hypothetical protein